MAFVESILDDFCKLLEKKKDYVKLLATRKLQLEVWFEVEMYMMLDRLGIKFETEKEYPHRKGWFTDLIVYENEEQKNLIEVKVRLLKSGSASIIDKRVKEAFSRLSEGFKDRTVGKWCLVIAYPALKGKEQSSNICNENENIQIVKRCIFSIDEKNDCLVLLYKID